MKRNGFTLIELLVVVAIIGILAAVGVVAYNGYTGAARVSVIKTNYNNYHKFIKSELTKCNNGLADKAFNISCPINNTRELIRGLNIECSSGDLSKIMNPHLSNTKACRNYLANGNPVDVGYINWSTKSATDIRLSSCWKTPCNTTSNREEIIINVTD